MTHDEVVEATPTAIEHKDVMPHGRVKFVAAARSKSCVDTLAFWYSFPFGVHVVVLHIKGDCTLTIVGIKVDGDFPTIPVALFSNRLNIAGDSVVGQYHAVHEERIAWVDTSHHQIDTTIRDCAVLIGIDRFTNSVLRGSLSQRRKN